MTRFNAMTGVVLWLSLLGLAGCNYSTPPASNVAPPAPLVPIATDNPTQRMRLLRIVNDYFVDHVTSIDAGIEKYAGPQGPRCRFLEPRRFTETARARWNPFDVYISNAKEGALARPSIFFLGDDNNRNGGNDPYSKAREASPIFMDSLLFSKPRKFDGETEVSGGNYNSFLQTLEFSRGVNADFPRGRLHFTGMLRAETLLDRSDQCTAQGYIRADDLDNADSPCREKGWRCRVLEVSATVDRMEGFLETLSNYKDGNPARNELYDIYALVIIDGANRPERIHLAHRQK